MCVAFGAAEAQRPTSSVSEFRSAVRAPGATADLAAARAAMLAGEAAYFAEELDSANTRSAELQAAMQAAMQAARAEAQAAVGRAQHTEAQSCAARSQLAVARAERLALGRAAVTALLESIRGITDLLRGDVATVLLLQLPAEAAGDND